MFTLYVLYDMKNAEPRLFATFSAMEQVVLHKARRLASSGIDPRWCTVAAYSGLDELTPTFLFTVGSHGAHLERVAFPVVAPVAFPVSSGDTKTLYN